MKKKQIFWVSVCLLLTFASVPLNAEDDEEDLNAEEDEEHTNTPDAELPPLKLVHSHCAYKADKGPCRAMLKRFFFNIFTRQCEEFVYGGCEGNENRFESLEECKEKCTRDYPKRPVKAKTALQEGKPDFCFLEEDVGICRAFLTRYFYNNQSNQCESFIYGGCLGNPNNFESLEECKNTCEDALNNDSTQFVLVHNGSSTPQSTKTMGTFGLASALNARTYKSQSPENWKHVYRRIGKCKETRHPGGNIMDALCT
ncbi:tissue factor pathway inhibitor isoform X2 [Pteronotus mesoamericanus]|uniref:tissue factor pathway inhibitor isoform X2 n=1 Tax=Pteronotus mesoamericanus TaxID=1884717 RepID=UPI0023EC0025|nr:tissue factor pathway inhibitor isoform X2 [Pteronotus parnellii mesoamericanus]